MFNLSRVAGKTLCQRSGFTETTKKIQILYHLVENMARATSEAKTNLSSKGDGSPCVRKIRSAQETVEDSGSDGEDQGADRFDPTQAEPVKRDALKKPVDRGTKDDFGKGRAGDGRAIEKEECGFESPRSRGAVGGAYDPARGATTGGGGAQQLRTAENEVSPKRGNEGQAAAGRAALAEGSTGKGAQPPKGADGRSGDNRGGPSYDRGRTLDAFPFGKIAPYEKPHKSTSSEKAGKMFGDVAGSKRSSGDLIGGAARNDSGKGFTKDGAGSVPRGKEGMRTGSTQDGSIPDYVHHYRILVGRHIEKVRGIYSEEIRPVFSWLYDELPKINTLERYIACDRLPEDMKPACGLLLAKAYGDLVLEWIQKQVPLHCKWKRQIFNEDEFDPRQELFDMIANYFASTALSYMKVSLSVNEDHPERSEAECNDFMLQILRCLSYMDKPDLLKTLETTAEDGSMAGPGNPNMLGQRLAGLNLDDLPNADDCDEFTMRSSFMDEPDENLPDFEIFYGKREATLFRKVWRENSVLREFAIQPDDLLTEMAEEDFPSSEFLITKISDVLDVLVEMINFELYTTHDRTFLLNAFAVKGVATPEVIGIVCGRYEDEELSTLELWEGIFARVYQTLYPEDGDMSESSDEILASDDLGDAPDP